MSNSQYIWVGGEQLGTLLEDVPAEINIDAKTGISSGTLNYQCFWDKAVTLVKALKKHPDFPWLDMKTVKITREEANFSRVAATYEGIEPSEDDDGGDGNPTYSVRGATRSTAIENHPLFEDFAGTVDTEPLNGARFVTKGDRRGQFEGFSRVAGETDHPKAGLRSYDMGGLIFQETKTYNRVTSSVKAEMGMLGYIDEPPNVDDYVTVDAGRDWKLSTADLDEIGEDGIKFTRKWELSGPNGWDPDIYTKPSS